MELLWVLWKRGSGYAIFCLFKRFLGESCSPTCSRLNTFFLQSKLHRSLCCCVFYGLFNCQSPWHQMDSFHIASSNKPQYQLILLCVFKQNTSVAQLCCDFVLLLASQGQALVRGVCVPLGPQGLLRQRGRTAEENRNAETGVVHFRSLRLVCWVSLPPHPTHIWGFLDSAGTWDPVGKFRLFMEICEIMSKYFMSFLQINSREIIGI